VICIQLGTSIEAGFEQLTEVINNERLKSIEDRIHAAQKEMVCVL
jgi:hypothetical protein